MTPDQIVSMLAASSQVLLAVAALVFTAVVYFDKARVERELRTVKDEVARYRQQLEMTELLATKVRELSANLFRAQSLLWGVIEVKLLDGTTSGEVMLQRYAEIRTQLERLNEELGLFSFSDEESEIAANGLVRGLGNPESIELMDAMAELSEPEFADTLRASSAALRKRLFRSKGSIFSMMRGAGSRRR